MPGLSEPIRQLINLHRRQLAGVVEVRGAGGMKKLYQQSRLDLEEKLKRMVRAGRGQTFGAHHLRLALVQVHDAVGQMTRQIEGHLRDVGPIATTLAPRHLVDSIERLRGHFAGAQPVLQARGAAVFQGLLPVPPSVLDQYRSSARLYGAPVIRDIRDQLSLSMLQGEGIDETIDRVVGTDGIFAGARWRAERIVRTELSYTYGVEKQIGLVDLSKQVPKLMKKLVETLDDRTGDDSYELNGQTVPVEQPFVWVVKNSKGVPTGKIVHYMQPPNRPQDRAITMPWEAGWPAYVADNAGPVEPTTEGLPSE